MRIAATIAAVLIAMAEAVAAEATPAARFESPLSGVNIMETLGGLIVVIAVMLGVAWLAKRYARVPGMGRGQVQVLGGVSLGAREKAVLLSVEGRRLLVGVAPGRVQTLLDLGPSDGVDDFAAQLGNATLEREAST
ncbi:MAG: flagellar biosynthetic protein FliO [Gammaproteobacteria bacterium]|nr:flagellar biosynthetic protein FliO [Gammaproteobacteria bacterium]